MLISVMMSTYNGEKFLRRQIDSILAQDLPDGYSLKIIVRDDGSTDSTLSILEDYCERYSESIQYYKGENLKPARSFLHLLKNCPQSDFYAFSDQDDYWYRDKLKRGIEALQAEDDKSIPLLYSSNVMVADANLNPIAVMNTGKAYTDFAHILIYNLSNGCTQIFNNCARDEIIKYDMENNLVIMHDRLADLITAMFGKIIYDERPSMLYRQHGNNVCGEQSLGKIKSFLKRVRRFMGPSDSIRSDRSRMFLKLYEDRLTDEQKKLLRSVGYYKTDKAARRNLVKDKAFSKGKKDDFFFHLAIRFKKI